MIVSAAAAFEGPARAALLPQLVERRVFPVAVALNSTIQMGAFVSGPVLMGFAVAHGGIVLPYVLHAALMVAALISMARVRALTTAVPGGRVRLAAIVEGLRYVRHQPVVLGCMTLDMFAVLFGGATALLPIYATDILQVGPRGYGFLASGLELGAVLAAVVMLALPPVRRTGLALIWAVVGFAISTIVFGLSRFFPLSLARLHGGRHVRLPLGGDAQHGDPAHHAGRAARPRQRRQLRVHRRVEPARRGGVGFRRRGDLADVLGGERRSRRAGGRGPGGVAQPDASPLSRARGAAAVSAGPAAAST